MEVSPSGFPAEGESNDLVMDVKHSRRNEGLLICSKGFERIGRISFLRKLSSLCPV